MSYIQVKIVHLSILLWLILSLLAYTPANATKIVTVDNFVRAETDMTLVRYVKQGAFGHFFHIRQPTPIDRQDVIRMNRDTIYSAGVFDLTEPLTVTLPKTDGRYMSMMLVNQNHSIPSPIYRPGSYTFTQENIGTRYLFIILRVFVDANDAKDIKAANQLQDQFSVSQKSAVSFEVPDWDENSLSQIRDAINVLAASKSDITGFFGDRHSLNPIYHLLGTAYGWGGLPKEAAVYANVVPQKNDGKTPHSLTVKDVPVDAFWSITVYNKKGFMQANNSQHYSFNNITAKANQDGSFTIHFGAGDKAINNIPITAGWNYIVRMYRPHKEVINQTRTFPEAKPM